VQGLAALLVSGARLTHGFYDSFAKMGDMARSDGTPTRLTSDHACLPIRTSVTAVLDFAAPYGFLRIWISGGGGEQRR
jgi:hypothetical protein